MHPQRLAAVGLRDRQQRQGRRRQRATRTRVQRHRGPVADRGADHHPDQGARSPGGPARSPSTWTPPARPGTASATRLTLVTPGDPPTLKATVTGLVEFGSGGLNGATLTIMDRRWMQQQFLGGRDVYNSISLNAAPGVPEPARATPPRRCCRPGWSPRTGDSMGEEEQGRASTRSWASSTRSCWCSPAVSWSSAPT